MRTLPQLYGRTAALWEGGRHTAAVVKDLGKREKLQGSRSRSGLSNNMLLVAKNVALLCSCHIHWSWCSQPDMERCRWCRCLSTRVPTPLVSTSSHGYTLTRAFLGCMKHSVSCGAKGAFVISCRSCLWERNSFVTSLGSTSTPSCHSTDPLYETVSPATGMLSHLVPNCSSRRRYAVKDVAKESWAPDTRLSLYLFISSPPRKIPTATAGRFNTPRGKYRGCLFVTGRPQFQVSHYHMP